MSEHRAGKEPHKQDLTVRAIQRGLDVLQTVNRLGSARFVDVSKATSIPYPTVCRIIDTLVDAGMLEREAGRRRFKPTALVQSLSLGFQEDDVFVKTAQPVIAKLCDAVGWPITITTRVGNAMMVRASTHLQTTLTYNNYFPGYTLPLLQCSVGKVYVAFCSDEERLKIRKSLQKLEEIDPTTALFLRDERAFLKPYRDAGYGFHTYIEHTKNPGKTSSLAVPIVQDGRLKAAMGLVYFSSAMNTQNAAEKYVAEMRSACAEITGATAAVTQVGLE
ncbi:MAG: helix-turn-helix domain-containing protein [Pseudomonadota bacterium]